MSTMPSAQTIADRYVAGMQGASTKYKAGVAAVTESPTAKAARNLEKARREYNAAIDSGKTAARLNAVSLAQWQALASTKGANNLGAGAAAAKNKVVAYYQAVGGALANLQAQIAAMPNDTEADREARALAWMRGARQIAASRN